MKPENPTFSAEPTENQTLKQFDSIYPNFQIDSDMGSIT